MSGDAGPGFPWSQYSASNQKFKDVPELREMVVGAAFLRVKRILFGESVDTMTPMELLQSNAISPTRLFVKQEPHNQKKLKAGRYRLISGMALDDQLVDRALFSTQNKAEIREWENCPSKPGIGLDDDGLLAMSRKFREMLKKSKKLVSMDVSGWDWSVQLWELMLDLKSRRKLLGMSKRSAWYRLARARFVGVAKKVYILPDGSLHTQSIPGVQASGWYNTSSTNSRMRVLVRAVAYSLWCEETGNVFDPELAAACVAMGDDSVECELDDRCREVIEELGHTIKDVAHFTGLNGVEFCSHRWFADGLAAPLNVVKTMFKFFNHPRPNPAYLEWAAQLEFETRNCSDRRHLEIIQAGLCFAEEANLDGPGEEDANQS